MLKRVSAWVAVLVVLFITPVLVARAASSPPTQNGVPTKIAPAARYQAPSRSTGQSQSHFLTLPFNDPSIVVQNGWIYNTGYLHGGTDYVLGKADTGRWSSFDVVASADGWACGNCTSRQGNAVWIKHLINGQTYYTYYGHLASIDSSIPVGSQSNTVWVTRGQKIGISGSTGADSIHLHFQINMASGPVDPYDLWASREPYMPGCGQCDLGPNNLWTTNPPSFASGDQLPPSDTGALPGTGSSGDDGTGADSSGPGTATGIGTGSESGLPAQPQPTATRRTVSTPAPTASPTAVPCNLPFGKTVDGILSDTAPEVRYCVAGQAGSWISVRMFAADGSSVDTMLKLYGSDGKLVAQDDDGAQVDSNSFLVQKLPKTGTYRLVATRYTGTGIFRLRMDKGPKSALGDLNRDCAVDGTDIGLMVDSLGSHDPDADINLDGVVDATDQHIQLLRLGRGCTRLTP